MFFFCAFEKKAQSMKMHKESFYACIFIGTQSKSNSGDCFGDSHRYRTPHSHPLFSFLCFPPGIVDEHVAEDTMAAHTTSSHHRESEQTRHRHDLARRDCSEQTSSSLIKFFFQNVRVIRHVFIKVTGRERGQREELLSENNMVWFIIILHTLTHPLWGCNRLR